MEFPPTGSATPVKENGVPFERHPVGYIILDQRLEHQGLTVVEGLVLEVLVLSVTLLAMTVVVPAVNVRSEVRHNLFLAFKESLNNVVKHAHATEVRITMQLAAPGLSLSVADNGSGFDPQALSAPRAGSHTGSGNGLKNIRSRLEQIGGRCVIHSSPGKETRIELFAPLASVSSELTTTRPQ